MDIILKITLIFISIINISGCITSNLHKDYIYTEFVQTIAISSDQRKIAVIGEEFHYIFDAPPNLINLINSEYKEYLGASFQSFVVDSNNKIKGDYVVSVRSRDKLTNQDINKFNLKLSCKSGRSHCLEGTLEGIRYKAAKLNIDDRYNFQSLNNNYRVKITKSDNTYDKIAKAVITPIAMTADGILIIGTVVLLPIIIPVSLPGIVAAAQSGGS